MRFDYLAPESIGEAIAALSRFRGSARIIAGGTDLINLIRTKAIRPHCLVDIGNIPGLDVLKYDPGGTLTIGALATIRSLELSAAVRDRHAVIAQAARQLGSMAIRNVGTIGGNLCHASPAADMVPCLIALGATAKITGPGGERAVPVEDFFVGPGRTVLEVNEVLVGVRVPAMASQSRALYLKHAIRGAADLAIVGVAAMARLERGSLCGVRIALGAVAPTPMRAKIAEKVLEGKRPDDALIVEAAQLASAECRPITDVRASAEYRKEIVKILTRWSIKQVIGAPGPEYEWPTAAMERVAK